MAPDPMEVIAELQARLRQQVQATVSAAQTAQLAILRLEKQQPLVDAAIKACTKDSMQDEDLRDAVCEYQTWQRLKS